MPKKVSVLVLNWNNWADTARCLESLQAVTYKEREIILLDNGSTDDSVARVREKFPNVEVMELGENWGFAKGNNAGIREALSRGAEYVWLLNNDTTVDPNALTGMVELAESDEHIGAIGSAIYSMAEPERLRVWGGGRIDFWLGRSRHFEKFVEDGRIEFLTGASLMIRRRAVESVGLLDEEFFMYWEDADYCFRLRQSGWRLAVAGGSKVWHKEQGSVGKRSPALDAYSNRSAARFFRKYADVPSVPLWGSVARRVVKLALTGDWARVRGVWETSGLRDSSGRISG